MTLYDNNLNYLANIAIIFNDISSGLSNGSTVCCNVTYGNLGWDCWQEVGCWARFSGLASSKLNRLIQVITLNRVVTVDFENQAASWHDVRTVYLGLCSCTSKSKHVKWRKSLKSGVYERWSWLVGYRCAECRFQLAQETIRDKVLVSLVDKSLGLIVVRNKISTFGSTNTLKGFSIS